MSRKEVSMIGNLTRDMMRDVMETSLKKPIQTGEFRKNPVEPAWRCPNDYIYELIPTEKFVMEYLKPKQAVTGRVILQLHGGGYIGPMKNIYRRFAVKYSELGLGADVLTPDYRVAPEHPFPAALEDAVYAYKWLLNEKKYDPSRIVVAGDSAGGGLALALCLYAKDHALPLPAGIITMSPWTDVTLSVRPTKRITPSIPCSEIRRKICSTSAAILGTRTRKTRISPRFLEISRDFRRC